MKSWAWALGPWDLPELLAEQSSSQGSPPSWALNPLTCAKDPLGPSQMGDPSH